MSSTLRQPRSGPARWAAAAVAAAVALGGGESGRCADATASPAPPVAELPAWEFSATTRAAVGWKDNVLLSPIAAEGRAFGRGEVEALAWRLPEGAWEILSFLNGSLTRYRDPPPGVSDEQEWFAHAEARWQPRPRFRGTATLQGYFQDQVFDLSATGTERFVARLKARGALATVEARMTLSQHVWLAAFGQGHRSDYQDYNEDFEEGKAGARLVWTLRQGLTLSAAASNRFRGYADRNEYTAGGRPLAGTQLRFRQREAEIKAEWKAGQWNVTASGSGVQNRDGASGYFDYDERRARLAISWQRASWKWAVDGVLARYDYRVQTVGIGFDPPLRQRDDDEWGVRLERSFGNAWMAFADARAERSRDNEADTSYRATTSMAGVAFTF